MLVVVFYFCAVVNFSITFFFSVKERSHRVGLDGERAYACTIFSARTQH